jgi:gas vesicle protein
LSPWLNSPGKDSDRSSFPGFFTARGIIAQWLGSDERKRALSTSRRTDLPRRSGMRTETTKRIFSMKKFAMLSILLGLSLFVAGCSPETKDKVKDAGKSVIDDTKAAGEKAAEEAKHAGEEAMDEAKHAGEKVKEAGEEAIEDVKEAGEKAVDEVENAAEKKSTEGEPAPE